MQRAWGSKAEVWQVQVTLKTTRSAHWAAVSRVCASALGRGRVLPGVPHAFLEGGAARPAQATTQTPGPQACPTLSTLRSRPRGTRPSSPSKWCEPPRPWPPRGTPSGSQDRREQCTRPRAALKEAASGAARTLEGGALTALLSPAEPPPSSCQDGPDPESERAEAPGQAMARERTVTAAYCEPTPPPEDARVQPMGVT